MPVSTLVFPTSTWHAACLMQYAEIWSNGNEFESLNTNEAEHGAEVCNVWPWGLQYMAVSSHFLYVGFCCLSCACVRACSFQRLGRVREGRTEGAGSRDLSWGCCSWCRKEWRSGCMGSGSRTSWVTILSVSPPGNSYVWHIWDITKKTRVCSPSFFLAFYPSFESIYRGEENSFLFWCSCVQKELASSALFFVLFLFWDLLWNANKL